jgi:hypothetical protein
VPQDLASHACLTFAFADGERRWRLSRDGQHEWVRVAGPLRTNHADTIREIALAGAGLALLPTWLVGEDVAQGRLCSVLGAWQADVARPGAPPPGDAGIHALYLPDRARHAPAGRFPGRAVRVSALLGSRPERLTFAQIAKLTANQGRLSFVAAWSIGWATKPGSNRFPAELPQSKEPCHVGNPVGRRRRAPGIRFISSPPSPRWAPA